MKFRQRWIAGVMPSSPRQHRQPFSTSAPPRERRAPARQKEDRRSDVVVLLKGEAGQFILHLEIQNNNDSQMVYRMLRYRNDIAAAHNQYDIQQYLIYIGKMPLSMADGIEQTGLSYCYRIIDMRMLEILSTNRSLEQLKRS